MNKTLNTLSVAILALSIGGGVAQAADAPKGVELKTIQYEVMNPQVDESSLLTLPSDAGKHVSNVKVTVDNTFKGKAHQLNGGDNGALTPHVIPEPDPGYSPYLYTNVVWSGNHKVEYNISNGRFTFFRLPDTYYYSQNSTFTGFDAYTGKYMSNAVDAVGTYLTMQLGTVSKMARLFNWANGASKPFAYGDWALGAAFYEFSYKIPLLGAIETATVPASGTQSVLVYESDDGSNGSYHDRFRFDLAPDGTVTITRWTVS